MTKLLANKPLVEAILELRWGPNPGNRTLPADPHTKLLFGRLYDRVSSKYPVYEQLPTSTIPDEMVPQIPQYRFRAKENGWPLLQIGPGLFSINETDAYVWEDYKTRSVDAVTTLFQAHPKAADLKIDALVLRYINAIEIDYNSNDIIKFLREKMGVEIGLPPTLFTSTDVKREPHEFAWQTSHRCSKPDSVLGLKFDTAVKGSIPILRWETTLVSSGNEVPPMPTAFESWLDSAHNIIEDWFFKLIAGDLEKQFDTK